MAKTISIDEFLTKSEDWVPVQSDQRYKQITARLWGKGLTLRGEVQGSEIAAARQYKAKAGQFLISRIDARHGAFGIVPANLDGALVSNDFPCFDIDSSNVLPHFFEWYSRTPEFVDLCRRASEGSTNRVRMKEDKFLKMVVPLPSLDEQRDIVKKLDDVSALIAKRRLGIEATEREMYAMLLKAFQRAIDGAPLRPMSEVAPLVRRPVEIDPAGSYPELGARSFGRGLFHKPTLQGAELTWQKLFRVEAGDLVLSNIKAWEGAFAVAGSNDHGRVGSHRYLTCVPVAEVMSSHFLNFYLQTREGLEKVQAASPGSADRNRTLGQSRLEAITVPVPTFQSQRWFERILAKAEKVKTVRIGTAKDVYALMPSLLHEVFKGMLEAA